MHSPREGISTFWAWWPSARSRIESAIRDGRLEDLVSEIGERVAAISPDLDWELGPGILGAENAFSVSPKGDPALRVLTEHWLAAAPAADARWEFHPARQAADFRAGLELNMEGFRVELTEFRVDFEIDEGRERIDVELFHPRFAEMNEDLRGVVGFLMLDGLLGEDGVERWVGTIDVSVECPEDAVKMGELRDAVEELAGRATGESFAILRGQGDDGTPVFATINLALKRIDHLFCDVHVTVEIPLRKPAPNGLTTPEEAEELNQAEDQLFVKLRDSAVYLGRETHRGFRTLHLFAQEESDVVQVLEAWAARQGRADIQIGRTRDPSWQIARKWG